MEKVSSRTYLLDGLKRLSVFEETKTILPNECRDYLIADTDTPPTLLHRQQILFYMEEKKNSLRKQDSNLRPLGYEPNELPTAPFRDV